MTEIKSFKAVHYNQEKVKDLAKVVCPPYDVISSQQQDQYHNLSENNFIHVLLGKDKPSDDRSNNKYTRAKKIFDGWLQDQILVEDSKPCIYFYRQEYKVLGAKHSRLGFISLMKLQDEKDARIYPHENTHARAKEDRLKLWKSLSANLSPIFVCFSDKEKKVETVFAKHVAKTKPLIDIEDVDGVKHILWRLDDPALIKTITGSMDEQQLFIADGHHRYEVASEYRRQRIAKAGKSNGREGFNYVMTYFTNIDSRDLKIFPIHRIIKNVPADIDFLEETFRVDKIKTRQDFLVMLAKAGQNEHAFGFYTRQGMLLLRLKNKLLIDKYITEGSSDYRHLDATILKYFVLDKMNVKSEEIVYTPDSHEAMNAVDDKDAGAAFLMNPVRIQQLKNIALNGERMPPKTTYFYPKVLSGLTIYKID